MYIHRINNVNLVQRIRKTKMINIKIEVNIESTKMHNIFEKSKTEQI